MGNNGSGQNQHTKATRAKPSVKSTRIGPSEKARIVRLFEEGYSAAAIARETGRHYNTITQMKPGTRKKAVIADLPAAALEDFGLFRARYMGRVTTPWQELAAMKIVELLETEDDEYLVINVPPGCGKSTLMTDTCTWVLARDRSKRIMYGSASQQAASNYTNQVMDNFQRPDLTRAKTRDVKFGLAVDGTGNLARDYGQFKPANGARWTKEKFFVAQDEGRTAQEKDPSMVAFGRDSTFLGGRFDLVIWDDLVSEKTLRTQEARESLVSWWNNTAETRVEPGGLNVLVGQRLDGDDLYRYAIDLPSGLEWDDVPQLDDLVGADPEANYSRKYHHVMFPAHDVDKCKGPTVDNPDHGKDAPYWPDGCLLDPRRLGWKKLAMIQANPLNHFETVYQQQDADPSTALIRKEWVDGGTVDGVQYVGCKDIDRALGQIPHGLGPSWSVMSVDPSPTRYWSIQWWLCHEETQRMYLIDHVKQKMEAPDWLDYDLSTGQFVGIAETWYQRSVEVGRPITHMIVEKNAAQQFMLQSDYIKRWQSARSVLIVPHSTTSNKLDPTYGVQSLAPEWMHGRIRLPYKGHEAIFASQKLVHEALHWPHGASDDAVMAHWFTKYQWPRVGAVEAKVYQFRRPSWVA
jgi:hypothetical protein